MGVDAIVYCHIPREVTDDEIHRVAVVAQISLGRSVLWIDDDADRMSLHRVSRKTVRMPEAPKGGTWIDVSTMARYYGVGYERGPILEIIALRDLMLHHWPDATVYYGGDSDVGVAPMTDEVVASLKAHLFGGEGRDYFMYGGDRGRRFDCPRCRTPTSAPMSGNGGRGHRCLSCGWSWFISSSGEVTPTERDFRTPRGAKVPTVELPLLAVRAILKQLYDGDKAGHAAVELELLLADVDR